MSASIPLKRILNHTRTHGDSEVFPCNFADFADLEDFNWPGLKEGGVCSRRLYWINCRADRALGFRQNRIRFAQELMEIFRFFHSISPILLVLRISTGQRFRKEQSVQDACMG